MAQDLKDYIQALTLWSVYQCLLARQTQQSIFWKNLNMVVKTTVHQKKNHLHDNSTHKILKCSQGSSNSTELHEEKSNHRAPSTETKGHQAALEKTQ